jgi:hypothetical protein
MKTFLRPSLAFSTLFLAVALVTPPLQARTDSEQVSISVGRLLEEGHYTHQSLDDEVFAKVSANLSGTA